MSDEYELYHGVALRQIVVSADSSVRIESFPTGGRVNAFVLNETIGLFLKHSSKRLSPWQFTFQIDQLECLRTLEASCRQSYVVFVCGMDGMLTMAFNDLHGLLSFEESEQAWIRIERKPRSQYNVCGNQREHPRKIATGTALLNAALVGQLSMEAKGPNGNAR